MCTDFQWLLYILSGRGTIAVGDEPRSVAAGDLLYIEEGMTHDVLEVETELLVLKLFADGS